jgi:hypothetical protein
MMRVYIASPYTNGDVQENVGRHIACADALMDLGYSPYAPLLCHFHHSIFPRPYESWFEHVSQWIKLCNALLRLPGKSPGADKEMEIAREHGIPVYLNIEDLQNDRPFFRATRSAK